MTNDRSLQEIMMNVLVTGGAGFIGSHVADELLAAGHRVVVVDNLHTGHRRNVANGATFYQADIRDPQQLAKSLHRRKSRPSPTRRRWPMCAKA
jgi:nucleoside-diphosphate-sugar epimerase